MMRLTRIATAHTKSILVALFLVFPVLVWDTSSAVAQQNCVDGLAADLFPCDNVNLLAHVNREVLATLVPGGDVVRINDLWGWTDPLSGREFAIVCRENGTAFVEVTDPLSPVYLGDLPYHSSGNVSRWRDAKTFGNYAYIVADGAGSHGVQIFDLTQLLSVSNPPVLFDESGHYDEIGSAHNIVINPLRPFAYAVGTSSGSLTCGGGLHVMSLADPLNPQFAGCVQIADTGRFGTGYTHDAQCVTYSGPDGEHRDKEICFLFSENAISIVDVGDIFTPIVLSIIRYNSVEYSHQGWLSEDHATLFADDELDERSLGLEKTRTLIFDVSDLDRPVMTLEFQGRASTIDHNQYTRSNYLYQSNYTSGLTIYDISNPSQPIIEGFFDTYPSGDDFTFNGSWTNYPYFSDGKILITDRDGGLFIVNSPTIVHDLIPEENEFTIDQVYPNPSDGKFSIEVSSGKEFETDILIYDSLGRLILETEWSIRPSSRNVFSIDLENRVAGLYIVSIQTSDHRVSRNLVVQ